MIDLATNNIQQQSNSPFLQQMKLNKIEEDKNEED